MKFTNKELVEAGYRNITGYADTECEYSIWQRRDLVMIRDDRTLADCGTVALDSFGKRNVITNKRGGLEERILLL